MIVKPTFSLVPEENQRMDVSKSGLRSLLKRRASITDVDGLKSGRKSILDAGEHGTGAGYLFVVDLPPRMYSPSLCRVCRTDIVKRVFYEPSPVQLALRTPPELRTAADIRCVPTVLLKCHLPSACVACVAALRVISDFISVLHVMKDLTPAIIAQMAQVCTLLSFLQPFPLIVYRATSQTIKYAVVDKDHIVCEQNAVATEFYIVMSGSMSVKVFVPGATETRVGSRCCCAPVPRPTPVLVDMHRSRFPLSSPGLRSVK